jgi:arylsulfatase A-like enzyme
MPIKKFSIKLLIAISAIATTGLPPLAADDRPNILICISDDQSYAHTGANGDPVVKTPAFDRIAREGLRFTHAFCDAPTCGPSRSAILTGQHIWRLEEAGNIHSTLPAKFPTYTELLKSAGYAIGHTGKGWGPGRLEPGGRAVNPAGKPFNQKNRKPPFRQIRATDYSANFEDFLDQIDADQPFCFWLGTSEPHRGFQPGAGKLTGKDSAKVVVPPIFPDTDTVRNDILDYLVEVEYFDSVVEEAISLLEARGELDNTLIVVTSDHGMPFPRAKASLYDAGTRVPLAIRWPRGIDKPGRTNESFVNLSDLAPTFLEAAGLKPPASMTGHSLVKTFKNHSVPSRDAAFFAMERHDGCRAGGKGYPCRAIRTSDYLYIYNFEPTRWPSGSPDPTVCARAIPYGEIDSSPTKTALMQQNNSPEDVGLAQLAFGMRPAEELYDLKKDPHQLVNLATTDRSHKVQDSLHKRLFEYLRETKDPRVTGGSIDWDFYPYYGVVRTKGWSVDKKEPNSLTSPPNVVFFLVDDLGWSDVGCYGSSFYETPNIDHLSSEGVRFTDAYAACHVCSPTRASILTGKYPATLNLTDWLKGRRDFPFQKLLNAEINQQLPKQEVTIAEALKQNGYATAIFGKWHLGNTPTTPLEHGFDIHVPNVPSNWRTFHGPFGMKNLKSKKGDYLTDRLTDAAIEWIERKKDEPFFLYMSHFAVHDPIQGRRDLVDKYSKKLKQMPSTESADFILEGNPDNPRNPTRQELTQLIQTREFARHKVLPRGTIKIKQKQDNPEFAAMVEGVDQSLGRITRKLSQLGLEDNTIVIFFSDNGGMAAMNVGNPKRIVPEQNINKAYSTSCLPLRGAKGWLYEGGIRVPLIVKWPSKGQANTVCSTPVSSIDFFPTIMSMVGLEESTSSDKEGVNISPLLLGNPIESRSLYWHFPHYSNHGMHSPGGAIRSGKYKLLEYFENGSVQLFDLENDIGEQNDLSKIELKKAEELQSELELWRKKVGARIMKPNPTFNPDLQAENYYLDSNN